MEAALGAPVRSEPSAGHGQSPDARDIEGSGWTLPPNASRDLASAIDGAKLVELAGDDPMFFLGDTGELLDAIEEFLTGDLSGCRSDRVLSTMMFTDLVGFTEQASRLGDRDWTDLLAVHDAIISTEVDRQRGRQVPLRPEVPVRPTPGT